MKNYLRCSLAVATLSLTFSSAAFATETEVGFIDIGQMMPSANGQFVEVKGTFGQLAGSTLTATTIEFEPVMEAAENELVEAEGIVMNFVMGTMTSTFTVNGVNVSAVNALLTSINNGVEAEVKGNSVGGVLMATAVKVD